MDELEQIFDEISSNQAYKIDIKIYDQTRKDFNKMLAGFERKLADSLRTDTWFMSPLRERVFTSCLNFVLNRINQELSNVLYMQYVKEGSYLARYFDDYIAVSFINAKGNKDVITVNDKDLDSYIFYVLHPFNTLIRIFINDHMTNLETFTTLAKQDNFNIDMDKLKSTDEINERKFIENIRNAILALSEKGKVDKAKISKHLGIKPATFNDLLKSYEIEYRIKDKSFYSKRLKRLI